MTKTIWSDTINIAALPRAANETLTAFVSQISKRETPLIRAEKNKNPLEFVNEQVNRHILGVDKRSELLNKRAGYLYETRRLADDITEAAVHVGPAREFAINEVNGVVAQAFEQYKSRIADRIGGGVKVLEMIDTKEVLRDLQLIADYIAVKDVPPSVFIHNGMEYDRDFLMTLANEYGIKDAKRLLAPQTQPDATNLPSIARR